LAKDGNNGSQEPTELRPVHRVEQKLVIYEISPDQLTMLTQRPGESGFLGIAVSLLSLSAALVSTFFANKPQTRIGIDVYVIIIAVTAIGGILALPMGLYYRRKGRKARSDLVERIKRGLPPGTPMQKTEEQGPA